MIKRLILLTFLAPIGLMAMDGKRLPVTPPTTPTASPHRTPTRRPECPGAPARKLVRMSTMASTNRGPAARLVVLEAPEDDEPSTLPTMALRGSADASHAKLLCTRLESATTEITRQTILNLATALYTTDEQLAMYDSSTLDYLFPLTVEAQKATHRWIAEQAKSVRDQIYTLCNQTKKIAQQQQEKESRAQRARSHSVTIHDDGLARALNILFKRGGGSSR